MIARFWRRLIVRDLPPTPTYHRTLAQLRQARAEALQAANELRQQERRYGLADVLDEAAPRRQGDEGR